MCSAPLRLAGLVSSVLFPETVCLSNLHLHCRLPMLSGKVAFDSAANWQSHLARKFVPRNPPTACGRDLHTTVLRACNNQKGSMVLKAPF